MTGLRGIGWTALVLVALSVAVAPDLITLPPPTEAVVVDRATLVSEGKPDSDVALPHVIFMGAGNPMVVRYRVDVASDRLPDAGLALYVPLVNRRLAVEVDGATIYDSADHGVWTGPALGNPVLVRLPPPPPAGRPYRLTLVVEVGPFAAPTYVSKLYLGSEAALAPTFKLRDFLDLDLKVISLGVQLLLGVGILLAWLLRPHVALLSWGAAFMALTIVEDIGMFLGFQPSLRPVLPFMVAFVPAWGLFAVILALVLIEVRPPRALLLGTLAVTVALLLCAAIGTPLARMISAATGAFLIAAGPLAASCILAWGAWRGNPDARIMVIPAALTTWFLARDMYVAATLPDYALRLYSPHAALLYVAGFVAVLGRRMADSFDRLDRSNEVLNARLAEREAELAVLARQEKIEAARLVREQERGRLTRDLHDGISGHLVSIIALSERAQTRPIEQAARDALNDLRLVIYSLDIDENELPLALANFRERLEPQLHRLGVTLDWSMAGLPDVAGVTPGTALAVLRIVQEAITNALKHGPARRIGVRGSVTADGRALIAIDNDGRPFAADSCGRGLDNMRRRAGQLGAILTFEALDRGTRVVVVLPPHLPDLET